MPFFPRRITPAIIGAAGAVSGWGLVNIGTGDGSNRTFNLPVPNVQQLTVYIDATPQPPANYTLSVGTGPGGVDQVVFGVGNAPRNGAPVEAAGTGAL